MMDKSTNRCIWCLSDPLYIKYHDKEWGRPVHNDKRLFEFLTLETFQAGLSWLTVLKKRENFKKAFDNFDFNKVAKYQKRKIDSLLKDKGIIRNRLKIEAAVNNAQKFLEVRKEFETFDKYIWGFVSGRPIVNKWKSDSQIPTSTPLSDKISKDLKKRGFKFVGTTIIYAHMQATGMVNDHTSACFIKKKTA
jgi:DNA-3-methyladenine glycosylase I